MTDKMDELFPLSYKHSFQTDLAPVDQIADDFIKLITKMFLFIRWIS